MAYTEDELTAWTRARLNWEAGRGVDLVPILKGGSDRRYFRVLAGDFSCILMEYGTDKEENQYYGRIGAFLKERGVAVPEIHAHDPAARLLWMEDLGAVDLHALRDRSWEERRALYRQTLAEGARLHAVPPEEAQQAGVPMMPRFDAALYAWERDYFYREFVGGACHIHLTGTDLAALEAELGPMAAALVAAPQGLVHRDFQSQNVMVHGGRCHLIDFQGMRPGCCAYDLASLLLDPYVELTDHERRILLDDYRAGAAHLPAEVDLERLYRMAGVQRLMQALGAYGFLGLKKGRSAFLAHIDPALVRLTAVVEELGGLPVLAALLRRCRESRGERNGAAEEGS